MQNRDDLSQMKFIPAMIAWCKISSYKKHKDDKATTGRDPEFIKKLEDVEGVCHAYRNLMFYGLHLEHYREKNKNKQGKIIPRDDASRISNIVELLTRWHKNYIDNYGDADITKNSDAANNLFKKTLEEINKNRKDDPITVEDVDGFISHIVNFQGLASYVVKDEYEDLPDHEVVSDTKKATPLPKYQFSVLLPIKKGDLERKFEIKNTENKSVSETTVLDLLTQNDAQLHITTKFEKGHYINLIKMNSFPDPSNVRFPAIAEIKYSYEDEPSYYLYYYDKNHRQLRKKIENPNLDFRKHHDYITKKSHKDLYEDLSQDEIVSYSGHAVGLGKVKDKTYFVDANNSSGVEDITQLTSDKRAEKIYDAASFGNESFLLEISLYSNQLSEENRKKILSGINQFLQTSFIVNKNDSDKKKWMEVQENNMYANIKKISRNENIEQIKFYIENKLFSEQSVTSIFDYAVEQGQNDLVQFLFNHVRLNNNLLQNALISAVKKGHVNTVDMLLDKITNKNDELYKKIKYAVIEGVTNRESNVSLIGYCKILDNALNKTPSIIFNPFLLSSDRIPDEIKDIVTKFNDRIYKKREQEELEISRKSGKITYDQLVTVWSDACRVSEKWGTLKSDNKNDQNDLKKVNKNIDEYIKRIHSDLVSLSERRDEKLQAYSPYKVSYFDKPGFQQIATSDMISEYKKILDKTQDELNKINFQDSKLQSELSSLKESIKQEMTFWNIQINYPYDSLVKLCDSWLDFLKTYSTTDKKRLASMEKISNEIKKITTNRELKADVMFNKIVNVFKEESKLIRGTLGLSFFGPRHSTLADGLDNIIKNAKEMKIDVPVIKEKEVEIKLEVDPCSELRKALDPNKPISADKLKYLVSNISSIDYPFYALSYLNYYLNLKKGEGEEYLKILFSNPAINQHVMSEFIKMYPEEKKKSEVEQPTLDEDDDGNLPIGSLLNQYHVRIETNVDNDKKYNLKVMLQCGGSLEEAKKSDVTWVKEIVEDFDKSESINKNRPSI